jgi:hypothetical protein
MTRSSIGHAVDSRHFNGHWGSYHFTYRIQYQIKRRAQNIFHKRKLFPITESEREIKKLHFLEIRSSYWRQKKISLGFSAQLTSGEGYCFYSGSFFFSPLARKRWGVLLWFLHICQSVGWTGWKWYSSFEYWFPHLHKIYCFMAKFGQNDDKISFPRNSSVTAGRNGVL